jgi:hypothetical protein
MHRIARLAILAAAITWSAGALAQQFDGKLPLYPHAKNMNDMPAAALSHQLRCLRADRAIGRRQISMSDRQHHDLPTSRQNADRLRTIHVLNRARYGGLVLVLLRKMLLILLPLRLMLRGQAR